MVQPQPPMVDGRWLLGYQARPWALAWGEEPFTRRLPEVMAQLAAIGFTGFETRLAYLPLDDPKRFAEAAVWANGLALCGAHIGGKWWAPEGAASIPGIVEQARRLPALGCHRLVVSMAPLPPEATAADLARFTDTLGRLGRVCREGAGVEVVAHNHASELADDAHVLQAIVERCAPEEVMLGPDLGWVARAGVDVPAFLRRFGPRITYLHLRDVTACDRAGEFIEVGRGVLDFPAILATLAAIEYRGWLVVESEFDAKQRGATDPRDVASAEFQGLRAALDAAGLADRGHRASHDRHGANTRGN